jgi:hypothetical protein
MWGGSPQVRGSTQLTNEWNPYSDEVVMHVFSTSMGIQISFVKMKFFLRGVGVGV